MLLIDKPFASDFLIKTIKENNFPIIITEVSKSMISDESLNWISEKEAIDCYKKEKDLLVYSNSENAISWIEKNQELKPYEFNHSANCSVVLRARVYMIPESSLC